MYVRTAHTCQLCRRQGCNRLKIYYLAPDHPSHPQIMDTGAYFAPSQRRYLHIDFPSHRTLLKRQTNTRLPAFVRWIFFPLWTKKKKAAGFEKQTSHVVLLFIWLFCYWRTNNKCHKTEIECAALGARPYTHFYTWSLSPCYTNKPKKSKRRNINKNKNNGKPRE